MISLQEVFEAYFQCRKNKRKTANQIEFELNYERNCILLYNDINNRTYKIGKSICFIVTRPKLREIFAANFKDRVVHHIIMNKLEKHFENSFIYDAYNCRKEKGVLFGVNRLAQAVKKCSDNYSKDCYIAKFDLKGFFMSIHKPTLWKLLKKFVCSIKEIKNKNVLLYLIKKVIYNLPQKDCIMKSSYKMWEKLDKNKSLFTIKNQYGLPIGNLTSQVFANFYLNELDHNISTLFLYYGRYVDDFYIIDKNKQKILNYIKEIRNISHKYKITLHPKKLYIQHYSKGCSFIGGVVKPGRQYIGNRLIGNCIRCIYKNNNNVTKYNAESFVSSINSYFGYFNHYSAYAIKCNLLRLISSKWLEFIKISSTSNKIICKYKKINIIKTNLNCHDLNVWIKNFIFSYFLDWRKSI